jgi:hypothetical protein
MGVFDNATAVEERRGNIAFRCDIPGPMRMGPNPKTDFSIYREV